MDIKLLSLFPGQGSQSVGMGKDYFEKYDIAKKLFKTADDVLGFPLSKICFEGPEEKLLESDITQPAILTVSTICYELWKEECNDNIVVASAGHSLGEYSALVASEALSFEDAVYIVNKRGLFMKEAVPQGVGKMCAVIGSSVEEIEDAISNVKLGFVDIANINAPNQIVISGEVNAVEETKSLIKNARLIDLSVGAPFHTILMKSAGDKLKEELKKINFKKPKFPVIANFSAQDVSDSDGIKESLYFQSFSKVRWVESMNNIVEKYSPTNYKEFGNGNILSGLMRKINRDIKVF